MPVRRRLGAVKERRINPIAYLIGDGTSGFTGDEAMPDHDTARRHWPSYRRETWARMWRGGLPAAAEIFDALTTRGADVVRDFWQGEPFPLARALQGLDADRAAVARFQAQDPRGARDIGDYLRVFLAHLGLVDAEARRLAAAPADRPGWQRGYPQINNGGRYGEAPRGTIH